MRNSFWSGVLATVVGGIVVGTAMLFVSDYLSKEPELEWGVVARYELPDVYQLIPEYSPQYDENSSEADKILSINRHLNGNSQLIFFVENTGSATAKNVVVEVPGSPVLVQMNARQGAKRELLPDGRLRMTLDAVEANEQAMLFVSGGAVTSESSIRVLFDGETVQKVNGSRLMLGFDEKYVPLSTIKWWMLTAMFFVSVFFALRQLYIVPQLSTATPEDKEEKSQ